MIPVTSAWMSAVCNVHRTSHSVDVRWMYFCCSLGRADLMFLPYVRIFQNEKKIPEHKSMEEMKISKW